MTIYKQLLSDDMVSTKTLLHEAIPITGTIISGTYNNAVNGAEFNIQNFTHGMFQSVYDYPYLSSSANHIFDISFGTADTSPLVVTNQVAKKDNVYNQMAQVLMGYDKDGKILKFDADGDLAGGGEKITEAIFMPFSRLLVKDEIKKGSFSMTLGINAAYGQPSAVHNKAITITDEGAATSYRVNSPAGEYGILYATASGLDQFLSHHADIAAHRTTIGPNTYWRAGLIYYQAGIAVLTSSLFMAQADRGYLTTAAGGGSAGTCMFFDATTSLTGSLISETISGSADGMRNRIGNIQFNNTIELNSSVYFCRIKHNEFNYSSNPTYLTGSQIRVKTDSTDIPISYMTSIGLYSADNQLLAVGKFSEPIRKDNNIELILRCRLDY